MGTTQSRRTFLKNSMLFGITAMIRPVQAVKAIDTSFNYDFVPPVNSFMDQYYDGVCGIIKGIRDTQTGTIAQAMEKAYSLSMKGGRIYSHVHSGHFAVFAGSKDRPGQPWLLPQPGYRPGQEDFDAMEEGDFLITSCADKQTREVHERGVYVAGVTCNYYKFQRTPPGGLIPSRMEMAIEDISDIVIDSQVPWNNGLVHAPQIPQLTLCPSAGITQFAVYWAATALLAQFMGSKGQGAGDKIAGTYLDTVQEKFDMIGSDRSKIDYIAETWADRVLEKGARILVYGHPQDVRPFMDNYNMFVNDTHVCSSGPMITDAYDKRANDVRESDIVLIGAFTSDNPDEINVARQARAKGAQTVAFCPYANDGDASGIRLFKETDFALNTYSDESAGVLPVKGFKQMICPASGLTGDLVMWMLIAQWADHMCRRGEIPYFWKGFHENGGREYDDAVHPFFLERGY